MAIKKIATQVLEKDDSKLVLSDLKKKINVPLGVPIASFRDTEDGRTCKNECYITFDFPRDREIKLTMSGEDEIEKDTPVKSVIVKLPYVYYFTFTYDRAFYYFYAYLSKKQLSYTTDTDLTPLEFFNCASGGVCYGAKIKKLLQGKSVEELLRVAPRYYWESQFNLGVDTYEKYGIDMKKNPLVKKFEVDKGYYDVSRAITRVWG